MERCYWTYEKGKRYHIPGCWGAVMNGPAGCYCYTDKDDDPFSFSDNHYKKKVLELEKEIAQLHRIIRKLTRPQKSKKK